MKLNLKNINYQEFLSLISGILTIQQHRILINYDDEIRGTLDELKEFSKQVQSLELKRFIYKLDIKTSAEISDVEVKKYLKKLTENFNIELTKTALFELEVFENMVFDEVVNEATQMKYLKEGWEIPTFERVNVITKDVVNSNDYKAMRNKVFPFIDTQLYIAKKYLQRALSPEQNIKQKSESNKNSNKVITNFQMENPDQKKEDTKDINEAKAYLERGSIFRYENFKKSISDSSSSKYYIKLLNRWDESQKQYLEENRLQEVSAGLNVLFNTYLSEIFTIYRHAFKYHESNNIKELTNITIKKARFDCLMNKQTDHFIANIESEIVKGKGQLALRRKKYVLGLFTNLQSFLQESSINFKKSPFLDIFTKSKEKIQNISFEEIKFLDNSVKKPSIKTELEDYKWVQAKTLPFEDLTENQKKNRIALELIGENDFRTTSIVYHHIEDVLLKYSLSNIEAKDILLTMRGSFSGESNKWVIPKIIEYLKEINFKPNALIEISPKGAIVLELEIKKHFNFFQKNCPRKHKQILSDDDFDKLINWANSYFNNDFKVPEISNPINVVNTNKGFVRLAFRYLFKKLHKEKTYPKSLFEFYKSAFSPYEFDKRKQFEAEKNNDEVKKLMEIDY
ncbi:hypothetical protein I2486_16125 [Cellulophaga sp. E16_2]|uniref:hypothetical protein n=1 Tax=Cellulophaga sp. E16_2 TaxID=2789297 RepID=UPI001A918E9F|nr:hypothetical protein [Cellulophaga sp. E16_2]MBO0592932.1 hypothetical protein [Cellulophaga sp. E16_2]